MRNTLKKWLSAPTLVALVFAVSNPVEAGYGSGGGSSGYGAGYGSSGGYYGGSSGSGSSGSGSAGGGSSGAGSSGGGSSGGGSSGGHVGPLRRLGARIHDHVHAKIAHRAAYGSSGGSSGGAYTANYGSSGGSHGGYMTRHAGSSGSGSSGGGSSGGAYYGSTYSGGGSTGSYAPAYGGGSTGSYGGSAGSSVHYGNYESYSPEMPMIDHGYSSGSMGMPENSSIQLGQSSSTQTSGPYTANKLASSQSIQPNEVHLTVNLPESAKVYVNGNPTTTTGSKRHFVSRDLKPKDAYRFEVKAVMTKPDGTDLVQTRTVVVESGNGEELNFELLKSDDPIETILTLNVPEKAKVVLAKNSTKSEGSSRIFRTKQLGEGESWDDYKIEVTHDGVTKEKTIRLMAGDKLELTFNFESTDSANKVAMK